MTYQQLKDFCNLLTEEQLKQEVYLSQEESAIKISSCYISEQDEYFDHTDPLGTLEDIKKENPDDWQDVVDDATVTPKGTVFLMED